MGEEAVQIDNGVAEWEDGLPSADDITPLSQCLIPPELASAFKISPETPRTLVDVNRATETTLSSLRSGPNFKSLGSTADDHVMGEADEGGSDSKRSRRMDEDSGIENSVDDQSKASAGAKKRARLVWTPQLHKRFVEVVAHLELKNAVPKTIMQLMNVEGLTRENVASHLQKYRLYVKRMQGLSNEGPSPSDHLFASTPLPRHSFHEPASSGGHKNDSHTNVHSGNGINNHGSMQIPMPYPLPPQIMPMPMMGMAAGSANSSGGFNGYEAMNSHHHYHHHHHHYQQQYRNAMQQQREWSGNKFNSTYSHGVTQNNK